MVKRVLMLLVSALVFAPSQARADFWITLPDGRYLYLTDGAAAAIAVIGIIVLAFAIAMSVSVSGTGAASDLPAELDPTDSAEHYEQEAARTRAYARKLDAETALMESRLRAKIKEDELKEIEVMLRERRSHGRK